MDIFFSSGSEERPRISLSSRYQVFGDNTFNLVVKSLASTCCNVCVVPSEKCIMALFIGILVEMERMTSVCLKASILP